MRGKFIFLICLFLTCCNNKPEVKFEIKFEQLDEADIVFDIEQLDELFSIHFYGESWTSFQIGDNKTINLIKIDSLTVLQITIKIDTLKINRGI